MLISDIGVDAHVDAHVDVDVQVSAVQGVEEQLRGLAGKGKDLNLDRRARAQQEALQLVSAMYNMYLLCWC